MSEYSNKSDKVPIFENKDTETCNNEPSITTLIEIESHL